MRSTTLAVMALTLTSALAGAADPPPWLGVTMSEVGDRVVVRKITRRSPAEQAGLRVGDVLLKVGDRPVHAAADVSGEVRRRRPGDRVEVAFGRGDTQKTAAARLGTFPGDSELLRMDVVGKKAPSLRPVSVVKGEVPEELTGKATAVVFFASWCVACRVEAPTMKRWHARFSAVGGRVIGVAADGPFTASKLVDELELTFAVTADPANLVAEAWQAPAVPTVYLVDKKGVVRDAIVGFDPPELRRAEDLFAKLAAE